MYEYVSSGDYWLCPIVYLFIIHIYCSWPFEYYCKYLPIMKYYIQNSINCEILCENLISMQCTL